VGDTQTNRQQNDSISFHVFLQSGESRLKINIFKCVYSPEEKAFHYFIENYVTEPLEVVEMSHFKLIERI
jgi:hypothetical protein